MEIKPFQERQKERLLATYGVVDSNLLIKSEDTDKQDSNLEKSEDEKQLLNA